MLEVTMSRPVLAVITVVFVLGLAGGGVLGWMFFNKDRVALLSYQVEKVDGMSMQSVVLNEEKLLESEEILKKVIASLNLVDDWGMASEAEAMAHMRKKLIVKEERIGSRIRVLYRDRKQERAFAILKEIRKIFPLYRSKAVERNELPPLVPESAEEGNGSSQVNPVPGTL